MTDQQRQDGLVYVAIVMTTVSTLAVLTRCIVRFILIRNPGRDDYSILIALTFTIGYMLEILILKANHTGFPSSTITMDMAVKQLKTTLAIEATYYMIVGAIKASIVDLYLRFAVTERFRMCCHATIAFEVIFTFICIAVTFTTSGINIVTDIWILALPMKTLGILNRPTKEKIALVCIFGAGTFAAIMSIVRLQSIYQFTLSTDPSRDGIPVNLYSMLEVNTAILCASVPALKPIFTWRKVQNFRHPNKYPGRMDDSIGSDGTAKPDIFHRKPSDASLYPHLETVNLTHLSTSRSPPVSPTWKQDQHDSRPPSARDDSEHQKQVPSQVV
ncbi:hypothetical protein N0V82_007603 [Gnomoniopsis sp. IMI 355080]|nr:hypothetical protein N0V82_007603 [Gnomoniopsis sp. IMI 355080]